MAAMLPVNTVAVMLPVPSSPSSHVRASWPTGEAFVLRHERHWLPYYRERSLTFTSSTTRTSSTSVIVV